MIKDRKGNIVAGDSQQENFLSFLYNSKFGKPILKLLCRRFVSELGRVYMESRLSKPRISKLVKAHNIDMSDYKKAEYKSFNEFFIRELSEGKRDICRDANAVIAPADSKLTVYNVGEDSVYKIKGCEYTLCSLFGGDEKLADEFLGGKMYVYRLTVDNYHRYCYIDNGNEDFYRFIAGDLHTVNPIATDKYDVYGKNCRELTLLNTENFGKIAFLEIGAMMVGRINNRHPKSFLRGEEKGYFSFGGSTIVIVYKKGVVEADSDITENSASEIETIVRYGEKTGTRIKE